MRRIIISGVPATGKTTAGEYLKERLSFRHFDVESPEADPSTELGKLFWSANISELVKWLGEDKNIVITWGFTPHHDLSIQILRIMERHNFKFVWLTAEEVVARAEFIKRSDETGRGNIQEFDMQMDRLRNFDMSAFRNVTIIETMDERGRKPLDQICSELP